MKSTNVYFTNSVMKEGFISYLQDKNRTIRAAFWKGIGNYADKPPVLIVQGRADFMERYQEIVQLIREQGHAVYSFDFIGQGSSDRLLKNPHKSHITSYTSYIDNLDFVIQKLINKASFIMIAFSMGGHIALRYLAEKVHRCKGAILVAPMLDIKIKAISKSVLRIMVAILAFFLRGNCYIPGGKKNFELQRFTFDRCKHTHDNGRFLQIWQCMAKNRDKILGGCTVSWLNATFQSINILLKRSYLQRIAIPVHIFDAQDDAFVDIKVDPFVCDALPKGYLTCYKNGYHDIKMEEDRIRVPFFRKIVSLIGAMGN